MDGRVKIYVWNPVKQYRADALCREAMLSPNIEALMAYGFTVRAKGLTYTARKAA